MKRAINSPETSVRNYYCTLRNIPEEHRSGNKSMNHYLRYVYIILWIPKTCFLVQSKPTLRLSLSNGSVSFCTLCVLVCFTEMFVVCGDGSRVHRYYWCDGWPDCPDNHADELNCKWRHSIGLMVRLPLKCDGTRWSTGWGSEGETGEWSGQPVLFTLPRNMVYPALLITADVHTSAAR